MTTAAPRRRSVLLLTSLLLIGGVGAVQPSAEAAQARDVSASVAALPSGGTLSLASGSYRPLVLRGSRWTRPVTVRAAPGARVSIDSVDLVGVRGLVLRGVTLRNGYTAVRSSVLRVQESTLPSLSLRDGVTDVVIVGNRVDGRLQVPRAFRGITVYSNVAAGERRNVRVRIADNDIGHQTEDNVFLGPADDVLIERNRIHDIPPTSAHQDGVQTMDSRDLRIVGNDFWGQDEALMLKAETGLWKDARVGPVLIRDNVTRDSRGAGFILAGTTDAVVEHNTGRGNVHADLHYYEERGLVVRRNVFAKIWAAAGAEWRPVIERSNCIRWFGTPDDVDADPRFDGTTPRLLPSSPCRDASGPWGARR